MGAADLPRTSEDVKRDVEAALAAHVARFLDSHGGAVSVASVSPEGDVTLSFKGACRACPAAAATFHSKVEPAVMAIPGVRRVISPNSAISPIAVQRILDLTRARRSTPDTAPH